MRHIRTVTLTYAEVRKAIAEYVAARNKDANMTEVKVSKEVTATVRLHWSEQMIVFPALQALYSRVTPLSERAQAELSAPSPAPTVCAVVWLVVLGLLVLCIWREVREG